MILVDTHVIVWLALDPVRLSKDATRAVRTARRSGGGVAIASISLFELAVLNARGRIKLQGSVEAFLQEVEARFVVRPLTSASARQTAELPESYPKDPIDRIIGATALAEGLLLVTADERIRSSKAVQTIW